MQMSFMIRVLLPDGSCFNSISVLQSTNHSTLSFSASRAPTVARTIFLIFILLYSSVLITWYSYSHAIKSQKWIDKSNSQSSHKRPFVSLFVCVCANFKVQTGIYFFLICYSRSLLIFPSTHSVFSLIRSQVLDIYVIICCSLITSTM